MPANLEREFNKVVTANSPVAALEHEPNPILEPLDSPSSFRLEFLDPILEGSYEGKTAKTIVNCLNAISSWAISEYHGEIWDQTITEKKEIEPYIQRARIVDAMLNAMRSIFKAEDLPGSRLQFITMFIPDLIKEIGASTKQNHDSSPILVINAADLEFFGDNVSAIRHDIKNSLVSLNDDRFNIYWPGNKNALRNIYLEISQLINRRLECMIDEDKKPLTTLTELQEGVVEELRKFTANGVLDVGFWPFYDEKALNQFASRVPLALLTDLIGNIAENSVKAYAAKEVMGFVGSKVLTVTLGFSNNDDGLFLEIIFDDEGEGYPPEIIALGLIEASKRKISGYDKQGIVPSTGVGLAVYAETLKHYGASLEPDVNSAGGARTILRIPFTFADATVTA